MLIRLSNRLCLGLLVAHFCLPTFAFETLILEQHNSDLLMGYNRSANYNGRLIQFNSSGIFLQEVDVGRGIHFLGKVPGKNLLGHRDIYGGIDIAELKNNLSYFGFSPLFLEADGAGYLVMTQFGFHRSFFSHFRFAALEFASPVQGRSFQYIDRGGFSPPVALSHFHSFLIGAVERAQGSFFMVVVRRDTSSSQIKHKAMLLEISEAGNLVREWNIPLPGKLLDSIGRWSRIHSVQNDLVFAASVDQQSHVVRIQADGQIVWDTPLTNHQYIGLQQILPAENGSTVLVGIGAGANSTRVGKVDSSGQILWEYSLPVERCAYDNGVVTDFSTTTGYVITGARSEPKVGVKLCAFKVDLNGQLLWSFVQ